MKASDKTAPREGVVITGARASVLLLINMLLLWQCVVGALSMLVRIQYLPPSSRALPIHLVSNPLLVDVDASDKNVTKLHPEASTSSTSILGITSSNAPASLDVVAEHVAKITSETPSNLGHIGHLLLAASSYNVDVGAKPERRALPATPTLPTPPRSLAEAVGVAAKLVQA